MPFIKYVFLAKGAPLSDGSTFKGGFTRALGQACRGYKRSAKKQAAAQGKEQDGTADIDDTVNDEEEANVDLEESGDSELVDDLPEIADLEQETSTPSYSQAFESATDSSSLIPKIPNLTASFLPPASSLKRLRPLDLMDLNLHGRSKALAAKIKDTKAAQASARSAQESAHVRLNAIHNSERTQLTGKQTAEKQAMEEKHESEQKALQQKLDAAVKEQKKFNEALARIRTSTPVKEVWDIVDDLRDVREANRRKIEQVEAGTAGE